MPRRYSSARTVLNAPPQRRTHLVEGRPRTEMDGRVVGFVTSYTDITEQKAIERELRYQVRCSDPVDNTFRAA